MKLLLIALALALPFSAIADADQETVITYQVTVEGELGNYYATCLEASLCNFGGRAGEVEVSVFAEIAEDGGEVSMIVDDCSGNAKVKPGGIAEICGQSITVGKGHKTLRSSRPTAR